MGAFEAYKNFGEKCIGLEPKNLRPRYHNYSLQCRGDTSPTLVPRLRSRNCGLQGWEFALSTPPILPAVLRI